jgi:2-polyprenyl-3-methyl-5-hydroxy-6-metoxy-1,4-benzoquinol methylase
MDRDNDVVIVDLFRRAAASTKESGNQYDGLTIYAVEGLHRFIADRLKEFVLPGGRVLDLGAGSGAISARLCDMGFSVTAVDIVADNFRLHGRVPFYTVNLNGSFADVVGPAFDGIVAAEVVEHLENPRNFLRQCHAALAHGGTLLLSTPNIDDPVSKAQFVRHGVFRWFTDQYYSNGGHITPISQWQLRKMACEAGFEITDIYSFGDSYRGMPLLSKQRLFCVALQLLSKADQSLPGEILVAALRKA